MTLSEAPAASYGPVSSYHMPTGANSTSACVVFRRYSLRTVVGRRYPVSAQREMGQVFAGPVALGSTLRAF